VIHHHTPHFVLQSFLCLDCGQKKTGIAHNFNQNTIAFPFETVITDAVLSTIFLLLRRYHFNNIIVGLPFAYPESESYIFIVKFTEFLQENLQNFDFIFWDETNSSNEIRTAYKHGRKGFSKKFYENYDKQAASLILNDFITCNF
jgi:RNase H-fold protein (predicted Holliday junction resolvase)